MQPAYIDAALRANSARIPFFPGTLNPEVNDMARKVRKLIIDGSIDHPIPADIYPVIDTDLARDNLENDLADPDLQDLHPRRPSGT